MRARVLCDHVARRGCCWTKARRSIGRTRTARRRCTSPARYLRATSTRRGCCWIKAPRSTGRDRATPLYIACEKGHVDAARLLLDKGAEVDRRRRRTPLWRRRSRTGHVDAAPTPLFDEQRRGGRRSGAAAAGQTVRPPLYCRLSENGHVDAARLLLDQGARTSSGGQRSNAAARSLPERQHRRGSAVVGERRGDIYFRCARTNGRTTVGSYAEWGGHEDHSTWRSARGRRSTLLEEHRYVDNQDHRRLRRREGRLD